MVMTKPKDDESKYTDTFIATIRLRTNKQKVKKLLVLSECGLKLYNAVLAEALKRLKKIQNTHLYKETIKLSKTNPEDKEKRKQNFKYLNETFGFTNSSLQTFGTKTKNDSKFIAEHLGTHVCQKISTRAFKAVQKLAFKKAKKVNFKKRGEFISLEGKNNETFLTYSNGYAFVGNLTLKCLIDPKDKWMQHALKHRVKYCRLISKTVKGKQKFYIQLALEGKPYQKYQLGTEETGLDIGPSSIAIVSDTSAELKAFCEEINYLDKEKRRHQRKMERQRRSNNPNNYNENGTIKKGKKTWVLSNRYKKTKSLVQEYERKIAEKRKTLHGRDINSIVQRSNVVKSEKLSYKTFQKLFGKSVGRSAPSQFITRLEKRMNAYGGTYQNISTYKTKLSQTCHCGTVKKKKLSERIHNCPCGVRAQRDLYSAFLAKCVTKSGSLSFKKAKKEWNNVSALLEECVETLKNSNQKKLSSFGI
jgi:hypothetical protein